MRLSKIIAELREVERLFGDLDVIASIEDTDDPRRRGICAENFVRVFTHTMEGRGRICFLDFATEKTPRDEDQIS